MLNSDLVFNVLTAAAALGVVVVLGPSAARTDGPAQLYASGGTEPAELENRAAMPAKARLNASSRSISTTRDAQLQELEDPALRTARHAGRP